MNNPTKITYGTFDKAYAFFNRELFGGELPYCLVTLQRKANTRGYFAAERFGNGEEICDEIALNPVAFHGRTAEQVFSTLVHEMVHLWQSHFGTPSRNGYHNAEWANKMEEIGLIPSDTGEAGGKRTGQRMTHYIEDDGRYQVAYRKLMKTEPTLYADIWSNAPTKKSVTSKTKFTCPCCGQNAWAKPTALLSCGECAEAMEPQ